jgi:hypothetical protein
MHYLSNIKHIKYFNNDQTDVLYRKVLIFFVPLVLKRVYCVVVTANNVKYLLALIIVG